MNGRSRRGANPEYDSAEGENKWKMTVRAAPSRITQSTPGNKQMQKITVRTVSLVCLGISTIAAIVYLGEWTVWLYGEVTKVVPPAWLVFWIVTAGLLAFIFFGNHPLSPEERAQRSIQRILEVNTALLMLIVRDLPDGPTKAAAEKVLAGDKGALTELAQAPPIRPSPPETRTATTRRGQGV